ncbi:hypothetical protein D918_00395 [Trichuris suis]|uniref:Cystatin domain-containing protein n=1 Tax=Trichuris suis TaxID=68888 RepID=A0A085LLG5_9BILA|nr:hypothetical protein M513_13313 [Trichuris suis]KHJ49270.1 hypothetical protein D918_00395 [Trichuris suis]
MTSVAIVVFSLLVAIIANAQEKKALPEPLELFVNKSKVQKPVDSNVVEVAKTFVDEKLKDEEKTLIWALKSSDITAVEGSKSTGILYIFFTAKVAQCPSETQKSQTKRVWLVFTVPVVDPNDTCTIEAMRRNRTCSLRYRTTTGVTNIACTEQTN